MTLWSVLQELYLTLDLRRRGKRSVNIKEAKFFRLLSALKGIITQIDLSSISHTRYGLRENSFFRLICTGEADPVLL